MDGNQCGRPCDVVSKSCCVEGRVDASGREIEQDGKCNGWESHRVDAGDSVGSVSTEVTVLYGGDVANHEAGEDEEDCDRAFGVVQKSRRPASSKGFLGEMADSYGECGEETHNIKEDRGANGKRLSRDAGTMNRSFTQRLQRRQVQNLPLHRNGVPLSVPRGGRSMPQWYIRHQQRIVKSVVMALMAMMVSGVRAAGEQTAGRSWSGSGGE